ncbi:MAG: hypothetical protein GY820_21150 [Gammaproteobacteria bacterium]|nr:hypothetical protein [Gammaproteobacteria bacterium]
MTMHEIIAKLDPDSPYPDIFPKAFFTQFDTRKYLEFRNLEHFRYTVSKLTQKDDMICGISYKDALGKLLRGETDMDFKEAADIRNLVRKNLHKRGLITGEVYESYRYDTHGTQVGIDVAKYAAGEPDCVITPTRQYIDFFYELYISISYPYTVTNEQVRRSAARLLATVEELERKHIFIKIVLVCPIRACTNSGGHFFSSIPLFSHKEPKSVEMMTAVVNDRLLRKFYFAVLENFYGDELCYTKGYAITDMNGSMNIGNEFNEIEFFETVMGAVGHDGD